MFSKADAKEMEKRMEKRAEAMEKRMEKRAEAMEKKMDGKFFITTAISLGTISLDLDFRASQTTFFHSRYLF